MTKVSVTLLTKIFQTIKQNSRSLKETFDFTCSQFSLVLNFSGPVENVDSSDKSVSEEVLRKAIECPEDEASLYISDEEMSQV